MVTRCDLLQQLLVGAMLGLAGLSAVPAPAQTDLGTLGGDTIPFDINNAEQKHTWANLYHRDLSARSTLWGPYSYAPAINAMGVIVGSSRAVGGANTDAPFRYSFWHEIDRILNDAGQLASSGIYHICPNQRSAFLLKR